MRRGTFREETPTKQKCVWCLKEFVVGRKHAKTCSPKCRQALKRNHGQPKWSSGPSGSRSGSQQSHAEAPPRPKAHPDDDIHDRGKRSKALAYSILGCHFASSHAETKRAYRLKVMECHPDRGGDEQVFKRVQAAWDYLCWLNDWS